MKSAPSILIALVFSSALLASCGGGGGGDSTDSMPATPVAQGRVIYNAPVKDARVTIQNTAGKRWEGSTDANGDYSISLTGAASSDQLLVRATGEGRRYGEAGGAAAAAGTYALSPALVPATVDKTKGVTASFTLYAVGAPNAAIPVTPVTSLVVNVLSSNRSDGLFAATATGNATATAAIAPDKVTAAKEQVKTALAQTGQPAALVDDPLSSSLVATDTTSAYDRLASGDLFGAMAAAIGAASSNAATYGCDGDAYGIMSDDGQRRPSCLPGANVDVTLLTNPFIPVETPRSLDIETRATELAGTSGPGGGWKYVANRRPRADREASVSNMIAVAIQKTDSRVSGTAADALAVLKDWSDATWTKALQEACKDAKASDVTELTHSYQALKRDMKGLFAPVDDAAENLFLPVKSRAVNRAVPTFFAEGPTDNFCAVFVAQHAGAKAFVNQYVPLGDRQPLSTLMASLHAAGQALAQKLAIDPGTLSTDSPELVNYGSAIGNVGGSYPTAFSDDVIYSTVRFYDYLCDSTPTFNCSDAVARMNTKLATLDGIAAKVPADEASGAAQSASTVRIALSTALAPVIIDEYEQNFATYYGNEPVQLIEAFDVQGYTVDALKKAAARDLSVLVPDVSQLTLATTSGGLVVGGSVGVTRQEVSIPAVDSGDGPAIKQRLISMRIHPSVLPALAACYSADQACEGRLRRTRAFTASTGTIDVSGAPASAILDLGIKWRRSVEAAAVNHAEVVPFTSPVTLWAPGDSLVGP